MMETETPSIPREAPTYWLTRFFILRLLGFVYFFAFLSLAIQVLPLIGSNGLLPATSFLHSVQNYFGSKAGAVVTGASAGLLFNFSL